MADVFVATAERFEHSAIFLHPNPSGLEECIRLVDLVREKSGDKFFLMLEGDATFSIPSGQSMSDFAARLAEEPQALKAEAAQHVDRALARAEQLKKRSGLDGFALCCDYCFNTAPFLSPRAVRRIRHAVSGAPDPGLPRHGLLHHQAHGRQHHADPRPARPGASRTRCIRSTRRAAWTSRRSSAAAATRSASSAT